MFIDNPFNLDINNLCNISRAFSGVLGFSKMSPSFTWILIVTHRKMILIIMVCYFTCYWLVLLNLIPTSHKTSILRTQKVPPPIRVPVGQLTRSQRVHYREVSHSIWHTTVVSAPITTHQLISFCKNANINISVTTQQTFILLATSQAFPLAFSTAYCQGSVNLDLSSVSSNRDGITSNGNP